LETKIFKKLFGSKIGLAKGYKNLLNINNKDNKDKDNKDKDNKNTILNSGKNIINNVLKKIK
jgi:hypothetical protein